MSLDLQTVRVDLSERSYDIEIGSAVLPEFAQAAKSHLGDLSHMLVIADEAVEAKWETSTHFSSAPKTQPMPSS